MAAYFTSTESQSFETRLNEVIDAAKQRNSLTTHFKFMSSHFNCYVLRLTPSVLLFVLFIRYLFRLFLYSNFVLFSLAAQSHSTHIQKHGESHLNDTRLLLRTFLIKVKRATTTTKKHKILHALAGEMLETLSIYDFTQNFHSVHFDRKCIVCQMV